MKVYTLESPEIVAVAKKICNILNETKYGEAGAILSIHNSEIKRVKWIQDSTELFSGKSE